METTISKQESIDKIGAALLSSKEPMSYSELSEVTKIRKSYIAGIMPSLMNKYMIRKQRLKPSEDSTNTVVYLSIKREIKGSFDDELSHIEEDKVDDIIREAERRISSILGKKCVLNVSVKTNGVDFNHIVDCVCGFLYIEKLDLLKKTREADIVWARHLVCYFAKMLTGLSLSSIGKRLNRDHTTVMNSLKRVSDLTDVYPKLRAEAEQIKSNIILTSKNTSGKEFSESIVSIA